MRFIFDRTSKVTNWWQANNYWSPLKKLKGKKDCTVILADSADLVLRKYLNLYHPNYWLIEGSNRRQYSQPVLVQD